MNSGMHVDFILSSIWEVLDEGIQAVSLLTDDISSYPMAEYLIESLYLRITGYQEQKLKCIMWELATGDMELRYNYLNGKNSIGECSRLEDKNKVYQALRGAIERNGLNKYLPSQSEIENIISDVRIKFTDRLSKSIFVKWFPRKYEQFVDFSARIESRPQGYLSGKKCLGGDDLLNDAYKKAYTHRNRCAHNLRSYQTNVPSLSRYGNDDKGNDNYFSYIFINILIDEAFRVLFGSLERGRTAFGRLSFS